MPSLAQAKRLTTSLNTVEILHMRDVTKGTPRNRREVLYEITVNAVELDLLYELVRQARNELPDSADKPEKGSWAWDVIELDSRLTTYFHKRR